MSINLETQLIAAELEKSRNSEPWDLITEPTVLNSHIYPKLSRNIAISFILSLVSSIVFAFIVYSNIPHIILYYQYGTQPQNN